MIDPIDYELQLPAGRTGEKLAKTIGRILKHTYSAQRLRIEHSKERIIVRARVERAHKNAIRGAVQMTMIARGMKGNLERDINASEEQSASSSDADRGARPEQALQEKPGLAADDEQSTA